MRQARQTTGSFLHIKAEPRTFHAVLRQAASQWHHAANDMTASSSGLVSLSASFRKSGLECAARLWEEDLEMALHLRPLSDEEQTKIERLARAQSAPVRWVRRARILQLAAQGQTVPAIARPVSVSEKAVRQWLKRFAAEGLEGWEDAPRSGRPRTYRPDETNRVSAKARSRPPKPQEGEVPPTCHWTLDRLQAELAKEGIPIKRSQIRRLLKAEHLKWQQPRTWLESTDPDCADKRGPSSSCTPLPPWGAR
jgi:transposase